MDSFERLKKIFSDFPTVGQRTAGRFVYHLIKQPKCKTDELIAAIQELKGKVKLCQFCFNPFEPNQNDTGGRENFCQICRDPRRNRNLLCIVEKEADLLSIENTKTFEGLYFILNGTIALMRKQDLSRLRLEELKARVAKNKFQEIIVALNPTPEGRATSMIVEAHLKDLPAQNFKLTHLARGLPLGGEMEYADEETLGSALQGRK